MTHGRPAALAEARLGLRSTSQAQRSQSATYLLRQGELGYRGDLGQGEGALRTVTLGSSLLACEQVGGCQGASIKTAALCLRVACPPGSTYAEALRRSIGAAGMQRAQAFRDWLRAQAEQPAATN